jgi:hypothetical protein
MAEGLPAVAKVVDERFEALLDEAGSSNQIQDRRDARTLWKQHHKVWLDASIKGLNSAVYPKFSPSGHWVPGQFELVADGDIDDQILASRLAMRVLDDAASELNELRLRIQHLEQRTELDRADLLLPEVATRVLVDQWAEVGMARQGWSMVQEAAAPVIAKAMLAAYQAANRFLVDSGVLRNIQLQSLVKRSTGNTQPGALMPASGPASGYTGSTAYGPASQRSGAETLGSSGRGTGMGLPQGMGGAPAGNADSRTPAGGFSRRADVEAETRMLTHATPLARARMRAQGVMGRLRRLLGDKAGFDFDDRPSAMAQESGDLQSAMRRYDAAETQEQTQRINLYDGMTGAMEEIHVQKAADQVRERTGTLKQAAKTPVEKATVEMVALMFLSILSEERILPAVRVWFARLQMPVLRLALSEPTFFGALHHPARKLIDRMGSCVLGFESSASPQALEAEIKRIVQVIEQYPETGRRVFELMSDEFEKFLTQFLTGKEATRKVVGVAQQVEQKETLAIQYTIELRKWLNDLPVNEALREFIYKVWVEVLAVSAVKFGAKDSVTLRHKQVAHDLLWAASAKPSRAERARVIEQMPTLLQQLRDGMNLLGLDAQEQDTHIVVVRHHLTEAFMSRGPAIEQERLDELAQRLADLEDILPEGDLVELSLDPESVALLLGEELGDFEFIERGGSIPTEAMMDWANELPVGDWFELDHNGKMGQVQLAWRSQRGQLLLFVDLQQRCLLFPLQRVGAYLQAGLLLPAEDEALTVRATREALAKLDANPERLLG